MINFFCCICEEEKWNVKDAISKINILINEWRKNVKLKSFHQTCAQRLKGERQTERKRTAEWEKQDFFIAVAVYILRIYICTQHWYSDAISFTINHQSKVLWWHCIIFFRNQIRRREEEQKGMIFCSWYFYSSLAPPLMAYSQAFGVPLLSHFVTRIASPVNCRMFQLTVSCFS